MPEHEHVALFQIVLFSPQYFAACAVGGALSCGLTHALVTPLDLVKCNAQANPLLFDRGATSALRDIYRGALEPAGFGPGGLRSLWRGWAPTLVGYSMQGALKFGLYEHFKHCALATTDPVTALRYRDAICIGSSAAAEVVADLALCPFEAVKVRVQTSPTYARGLTDALPRMLREEGLRGLYKGLVPLWARQVPYTAIKFAAFERAASLLYALHGTPKARMSYAQQLGVVFAAGYIAGVLCGVVSHPADVLVSHMYKAPMQGGVLARSSRVLWGSDGAKGIGFRGLWAGLGPRVVMIGTLTGLQWLLYGAFKAWVGLPTPGEAVGAVRVVHRASAQR